MLDRGHRLCLIHFALSTCPSLLIACNVFDRLCPADTFLDAKKSSDEKKVCTPCPKANQMSLPGSTRVEDCSEDITDLNFQLRFGTSLSYFKSAETAFIASIATVLSVNASRVTLLESVRRTPWSPTPSSYTLLEEAYPVTAPHHHAVVCSTFGLRRAADSVTCSFVSQLPKASAIVKGSARRSDPVSHLRTHLPIQLASDGLPSRVEVFGVSVACGKGREPAGQNCRPCFSGSFKSETNNGPCRSCPRHSSTSSTGAFSSTDCKCLKDYAGPARFWGLNKTMRGGPCFRNASLTMEVAKTAAESLTGLVVAGVVVKVMVTIGDVITASPASTARPRAFSSPGTLALITNMQFLNIFGRIGGSRASAELKQFSDGLAWLVCVLFYFFLLAQSMCTAFG